MSRTAEIRALARSDTAAAEAALVALIGELFDVPVADMRINHDQYSLNSLNGFFRSGAAAFFFKFHQEEGEEAMRGEYYRADILAKAGLPVDRPVYMSTLPGSRFWSTAAATTRDFLMLSGRSIWRRSLRRSRAPRRRRVR